MAALEELTADALRALVRQREEENAELRQQLLQAAIFGQELVGQNEALKEQLKTNASEGPDGKPKSLIARRLAVPQAVERLLAGRHRVDSAGSASGCSDAIAKKVHFGGAEPRAKSPGAGSTASGAASEGDAPAVAQTAMPVSRLQSDAPLISRLQSDALLPRNMRRARTATWEQLLIENRDAEEEHVKLQHRVVELENELMMWRLGQMDPTTSRAPDGMASTMITPRWTPMASDREKERVELLEEEMRERLLVEVKAMFQDRIDELEAKVAVSEELAKELREELKKQTSHLNQERARYSQLWQKSEQHRVVLTAAQKKIQEQGEAIERDREVLAARMLAVPTGHDCFDVIGHHITNGSICSERTLMDEVGEKQDLEELQEENDDLKEQLEALRRELQHAMDQLHRAEQRKLELERLSEPGGADDAGGASSSSNAAGSAAKPPPPGGGLRAPAVQLAVRSSASVYDGIPGTPPPTIWDRLTKAANFCVQERPKPGSALHVDFAATEAD